MSKMPDKIWAKDKTRLDGGMYWDRERLNLTEYLRKSYVLEIIEMKYEHIGK